MSDVTGTLFMIIGLAPVVLVLVGGIVLSLVWWPRAPRAALLAVSALALLLLQAVVFQVLVRLVVSQSWAASWWWVISAAQSLGHALALGTLVAAVFVDRTAERPG